MAPPRPQEFPADPQQVLRVLIFQGPPRFDPGVNEEVVARFVEQLQFPQEGEVRGRDRCAQPLAGTVGGKRGLSMALQQAAIASGRGPAAESEPSLAAAFSAEERSEERRVGQECGRTCLSRWSQDHSKIKK